jgi:Nitrile hydratase, alpha chain
MNQEEQGKKMSQLIAKCWADEGFKRKLLADPSATLKAEGMELPAGLSYKALENTDKVVHLVIPAKPTDLSDEDLDMAVGGTSPAAPAAGQPGWLSRYTDHACQQCVCIL